MAEAETGLAPHEPAVGHDARELRSPGPELAHEFEAIYRREFPAALRLARRYADDAAAEDAVQTVFLRYWEGYTRTPALVFTADEARTRAAILTAVHNELRTVTIRAKRFARRAKYVRDEIVRVFRGLADPESRAAEKELSTLVANALEQLPPRQREVFCLVRFDELSYDEAAEILGISPHTVHQHLVKANARLHDLLRRHRLPRPRWSHELHDEQVRSRRTDGQE